MNLPAQAKELKELRSKLKLSLREFSSLTNIQITRAFRLENGLTELKLSEFVQLRKITEGEDRFGWEFQTQHAQDVSSKVRPTV